MIIKITNWDKYQDKPRSVNHRYMHYIKLHTKMLHSHDVLSLDQTEFRVFINLILMAGSEEVSANSPPTLRVLAANLARTCRTLREKAERCLRVLEQKGMISIVSESDYGAIEENRIEENRTDGAANAALDIPIKNKPKKKLPDKKRKSLFDFELVYDKYPRRGADQNKTGGIARLEKVIKTQEDYDRLTRAVDNYRRYCEKEKKIGTGFVMMFSTFANERWKEWVDYVGASTTKVIDDSVFREKK